MASSILVLVFLCVVGVVGNNDADVDVLGVVFDNELGVVKAEDGSNELPAGGISKTSTAETTRDKNVPRRPRS